VWGLSTRNQRIIHRISVFWVALSTVRIWKTAFFPQNFLYLWLFFHTKSWIIPLLSTILFWNLADSPQAVHAFSTDFGRLSTVFSSLFKTTHLCREQREILSVQLDHFWPLHPEKLNGSDV